MATDYREVLRDLKREEKRLESELLTIRSMIPGAELMASRMPSIQIPSNRIFQTMGIKEAVITYLGRQVSPVASGDIVRELINGGIQTKSSDFAGSVNSTLYQLKGKEIEKVSDGWKLLESKPLSDTIDSTMASA